MNILSIRQPYASALLVGIYDAERRKYRLTGPTLIHAAKAPGMSDAETRAWLASRDPLALEAYEAGKGERDWPVQESALATIIGDAGDRLGLFFPMGVVVGYVASWEPVREGLFWANKPVGAVHFPVSRSLPLHKGALGQLPAPRHIVDLVRAWIPQDQNQEENHG